MNICKAKSAGFCFGVARAVALAEEAAKKGGRVKTLGPLIHNARVEERLASLGVGRADSVSEIEKGDVVIVRSHGALRSEMEALRALGVEIIDATCPDVSRIHTVAEEASAAGRTVAVIGDREHPEVRAICSRCADYVVFSSPEEVEEYAKQHPEFSEKPVSAVAQTTLTREIFDLCVNCLKKLCTNLEIFDTICCTTSRRQKEAAEIAAKSDAMFVIGDPASANSKRLFGICSGVCPRSYFIETADDVSEEMLSGVNDLGITAGASTPAWIIKEVNQKMIDEMNMNAQAVENTEPEVPVAAPAEEPAEKEESFDEMLEKSIKTLYTGEKVTGIVSAITPSEISVDLGTKQSGYIPVAELTDDPNAKVEDIVKVGDEIETYVMRVNDVEGTVQLSKRRLDAVKTWDDIIAAKNDKTVVEGTVTEENKGGVVVSVRGINVFVPASQSGLPKDTPMTELLGQKVRLRVTEVNQQRRRVVGSIRAVQYEERREKAEAIWNEIEVGKHYEGVVKSLTSYGAFVDIGGIDGMVHVSEISWSRIRQPSDVLSVGDKIDVYVISFDKELKKISLGHKDKSQNPWLLFTNQYKVGNIANVRIVKLMPFGAFAEIIPGVDGLIHISQLADHRVAKADDVVTVDQRVDVKIVDIDNEKQKVSLSIRALLAPAPAPKREEPEAEPVQEDDVVVYDTDKPPVEEAPAEEAPAEEAPAAE